MGTRSLTFVYDRNEPVICLYRQYDGYPSGHGAELAEFLSGFEIVNGFGQKRDKLANGMGCLSAQIVAHFKDGVGQFYLHAPRVGRDDGQDYEYHIHADRIVVLNYNNKEIFNGNWADFEKFCSPAEVA